jgi:hypothetical protein
MAINSIFPQDMLNSSGADMSLEGIAGKLTYFHDELNLLHWQTTSYATHMCTGGLYDYVHDFKDSVMEKLMGYANRRVAAYKVEPLTITTPDAVVSELLSFASNLKKYAENNSYHDVANLADSLSGEAAKTRYLLTLS